MDHPLGNRMGSWLGVETRCAADVRIADQVETLKANVHPSSHIAPVIR
jgi:hypothetical protein